MKFGIFYEHQLPRPWKEGDEQRLFHEGIQPVMSLGWEYDESRAMSRILYPGGLEVVQTSDWAERTRTSMFSSSSNCFNRSATEKARASPAKVAA